MKHAAEFKILRLRECPLPEDMMLGDNPKTIADYYDKHIKSDARFNPDVECFYVILLNTRRRILGHVLVSQGTMDTILVHPREVFRAAIIKAAAAVSFIHNHPSGEACPSEADIKVTRDLQRAGVVLKIEVIDHVIMGNGQWKSLRADGYMN